MHDGRTRFMVGAAEGPEPERKFRVRANEGDTKVVTSMDVEPIPDSGEMD